MTKPDKPQDPAKRDPETRIDEQHGETKGSQLEGNRRSVTRIGAATRGASSKR